MGVRKGRKLEIRYGFTTKYCITDSDACCVTNINGKLSTVYLEELGYYTGCIHTSQQLSLSFYFILSFTIGEYNRKSTVTVSNMDDTFKKVPID